MMAGGCNYAPIATTGPVKILTVLLVRIRSVRSGFLILSAVVWFSPLALAQDALVAQALPQIAKQASKFWQTAPGYVAKETLKQKAAVMPKRKFRIGGGAVDPPKPEMKDREIVSYYAISSFRNTPEALHEFRQVMSVDGKEAASDASVLEKFRAALASPDDRSKKALEVDFEKTGLAIAATDFGQLVLLFTKANLEKYTFAPQSTGLIGADRAIVIAFRQNAGAESFRIVESGRQMNEPLSGELWVRDSDFVPLRITLTVSRRDQHEEVRDEARVDYELKSDGTLLPASVVYRRFRNDELWVENVYEYSDWQALKAK